MQAGDSSTRPLGRVQLEQLIQLYRIAFGRPADADGLASHYESLGRGAPLSRIAADFVASQEFRAQHPLGAVDSAAFALALYQAAYGEAAAQGAKRSLGVRLSETVGLGQKLALIIEAVPVPADLPPERRLRGLAPNDRKGYRLWSIWNETAENPAQVCFAGGATDPPPMTVTLIMILGGEPAPMLDRAIDSIRTQSDAAIELIIVGWPDGRSAKRIARHAAQDGRIRLLRRAPWSRRLARLASALGQAKGDLVGFIGPNDCLARSAALAVKRAFAASPQLALVYTDEDRIDAEGQREAPWFKTDWDPDAMLGSDQVGRGAFFRRALLGDAVAAPGAVEDCWDYDLVLRMSERLSASEIEHLPEVLFHRGLTGSAPSKPDASHHRRAVMAHLGRIGRTDCRVEPAAAGALRVVYPQPRPPPLVSIIVPTQDRADLLGPCLTGVLERTDYAHFEVLIVDNASQEAETHQLFERLAHDRRVRILKYDDPFNWGGINNFAANQASGDILVLLNNDTEVIEPGWLRELVVQAGRIEVGVVGATLLYPDQTLQHAGMAFGPDGSVDHIARRFAADATGYRGRLAIVRSATAVTGACIALRKDVYRSLGGVEQDNLRVGWSDTDLCLKAWAAGYRVIVTPFSRLIHIELATRGSDDRPEVAARVAAERDWMRRKWGARMEQDPFFSRNFTFDWTELRLLADVS